MVLPSNKLFHALKPRLRNVGFGPVSPICSCFLGLSNQSIDFFVNLAEFWIRFPNLFLRSSEVFSTAPANYDINWLLFIPWCLRIIFDRIEPFVVMRVKVDRLVSIMMEAVSIMKLYRRLPPCRHPDCRRMPVALFLYFSKVCAKCFINLDLILDQVLLLIQVVWKDFNRDLISILLLIATWNAFLRGCTRSRHFLGWTLYVCNWRQRTREVIWLRLSKPSLTSDPAVRSIPRGWIHAPCRRRSHLRPISFSDVLFSHFFFKRCCSLSFSVSYIEICWSVRVQVLVVPVASFALITLAAIFCTRPSSQDNLVFDHDVLRLTLLPVSDALFSYISDHRALLGWVGTRY